jgi:hypothetical protein
MSQQSMRQAARRSALDAQTVRRKERAERERRPEGLAVAVLTALGERDAANDDRRRRPVAAGGGRVGHVSLETTSRRTRRSCQRRANRRRPNGPHGYAGLDIGRDNGEVVDLRPEDKAPFAFTGTIK